jgi:DNA-binding transcriptional regulator YiaG
MTDPIESTMDDTVPDRYAVYRQACKTLGERLAACRAAAEMTREQLAVKLGRSPSTIRNTETGKSLPALDFWRAADGHLNTGGVLAQASIRVVELKRAADAQLAENAKTFEAAGQCLSPADCLCRVAVAHWRQHEIKALRIAMRLGFREWASAMQTDLDTVLGWESPRGRLPNLEEQHQFDEQLPRLTLDARARFKRLLMTRP